MTPLTLYHYWRSSSSWRVRWACEIKGLKPKMIHVSLLDGESESGEHLKRNPFGYVPVLESSGKNLIESVAIIEWLEELVPSPQLFPGDAFDRAHIRSLVEIINSGIQPLQNLTALDRYSEDEEKRKAWSQFFVKRGLQAFQSVCASKAGKFSVGDQLSAADLFLIPQLYNAQRIGLDLNEFKILNKINLNALATSSAQVSSPDKYKPLNS